MRLLTPSATKDTEAQETARRVLRAQELDNLEKDIRIRTAKAEADFNSTVSRQKMYWAGEEASHAERRREMKKEVDDLEVKKLNSLVPFGILKEGADNRMEEAESFIQGLRDREDRVVELTEMLEDKLDAVGEHEQNLRQEREVFDIQRKGLEDQRSSMASQSQQLTESIGLFNANQEKYERDIEERKASLYLQDRALQAKSEELDKKEETLRGLETRLHDERGVLDRAWKELERMRDTISPQNQGRDSI